MAALLGGLFFILALAVPLARRRFPGRTAVETLVALPLVLPPSVVGYYLLPEFFYLWMGVLVGGGMIALGLYIRFRW